MKTDEQAAKEYAEAKCGAINGTEYYLRSEVYHKVKIAYMDGCQRVRTETDLKAMKFAEWLGIGGFVWCEADDCYCKTLNGYLFTIEKLFASPEFLKYMEENK